MAITETFIDQLTLNQIDIIHEVGLVFDSRISQFIDFSKSWKEYITARKAVNRRDEKVLGWQESYDIMYKHFHENGILPIIKNYYEAQKTYRLDDEEGFRSQLEPLLVDLFPKYDNFLEKMELINWLIHLPQYLERYYDTEEYLNASQKLKLMESRLDNYLTIIV